MSDNGDDYHQHQQRWEDLRDWGYENSENWEENEQLYNEELLIEMEVERRGREEARDEYGDDADEGHGDRIEKLKDTEQTLRNRIAYLKGEYAYEQDQYAESEQEEEQEHEVKELSDMELESDSDSN